MYLGISFEKVSCFVSDNALQSAFDSSAPLPKSGSKRSWIPDQQLWLSCASHNFNLLHLHIFEKAEDENLNLIRLNLDLCKRIVQLYKKSNLILPTTLEQSVVTRWDSR